MRDSRGHEEVTDADFRLKESGGQFLRAVSGGWGVRFRFHAGIQHQHSIDFILSVLQLFVEYVLRTVPE